MTPNKIKASVLIVNYNNSKYIKKCINSVLNQNYPNVEIIFLDDESNDSSGRQTGESKAIPSLV